MMKPEEGTSTLNVLPSTSNLKIFPGTSTLKIEIPKYVQIRDFGLCQHFKKLLGLEIPVKISLEFELILKVFKKMIY